MKDFLIKGATVLTLGSRTQNHPEADILVKGGIIAEVGPGVRSRSAEVVDGSNTIVMPGFVDAHRVCRVSLFKQEGLVPTGVEPSPDDVYAGTIVSLLSAAEAGVTTVVDWYDGPADPSHVSAALRAHDDSGLRTVLVLAASEATVDVWHSAISEHGLRPTERTVFAAGLPVFDEDGSLERSQSHVAELGLRLHLKGTEQDAGRFASSSDAFGDDLTVVHANGLTDTDLDAIASSGAGVALTPVADMTNGPGAPPMQDLLDRKIRPGLGVGDELQGPSDLLAQVRAAISIQHATYFDRKLAGKGGLPNLLSTRDVIRYGTIDGANAVGLGATTGSIEVGKQADLIMIRTDTPNLYPVNDPIGAIVWGIDTSNIDSVFVDGRPLMRSGVLDADVTTVGSLVADARKRMGVPTRRFVTATGGQPQ